MRPPSAVRWGPRSTRSTCSASPPGWARSRHSCSWAARAGARLPAFAAHARVALVAAPLVILTGLANSPLVVGDARELAASGYGNLLLTKGLLASLALGVGAANFFLARGASPRRMTGLAVRRGGAGRGRRAWWERRWSASSRPPTGRRPPWTPAWAWRTSTREGGESSVHGIVDLPEPGVQSYSFSVADPETGAGREDVAQVTVTFVPPPDSDLPPTTELAQPTQQPWIWTLSGAFTPVVGTWDLEIVVRRGRLVEDRMRSRSTSARWCARSTLAPAARPAARCSAPLPLRPPACPIGAAGWVGARRASSPSALPAWRSSDGARRNQCNGRRAAARHPDRHGGGGGRGGRVAARAGRGGGHQPGTRRMGQRR